MRLFLSYVRKEQELIDAFASRLRRAGFEVFLDTGLTGGQRWWDELIRQIQQCDGFLPILTRGYLLSRPCKLEAAYATAVGKPILPVQMDEISPRLLSPAIGDVQWVRYSEEDVNSLLDLVKALNSLPACPQLPDPLPDAPPLPVSYMEQLVDRVDSEQELTKADQREMLIELKSRLGGDEDEDARELLRRLKRRSDLQYVIALDIEDALTTPPSTSNVPADERSDSVVSDSDSEWDLSEAPTDLTATLQEHTASRPDLSGQEQATSFGGLPMSPVAKDIPPSGGSDNGSGDTSGGDSHGGRRRPWLIGAAAGVVVLAVVGVVLGLNSGRGSPAASPGMHSPAMGGDVMTFNGGTTIPMTTVDRTLVAHLDPDMRKEGQCHGTSAQGWAGEAKGAISCIWPHEDIAVTYVRIDTGSDLKDHFTNYLEDTADGPPQGNCQSSRKFFAWQSAPPQRFASNGQPADKGHLLCFHQDGHPVVVWTNDTFKVIAQARAGDGVNGPKLLVFWEFHAGLYGQLTASSG